MKKVRNYSVGDCVVMTEHAIDNYGEENRGLVFTVINVALNTKQHPGYDESINEALYDLMYEDGTTFPCSLYDCELKKVN